MYAMRYNTIGSGNSAFGAYSLFSNTTGVQNNAFGQAALRNNTSGIQNNAFGHGALQNNITGVQNNAFGAFALYNNTSGYNNVGIGSKSLVNNIDGLNNKQLVDYDTLEKQPWYKNFDTQPQTWGQTENPQWNAPYTTRPPDTIYANGGDTFSNDELRRFTDDLN